MTLQRPDTFCTPAIPYPVFLSAGARLPSTLLALAVQSISVFLLARAWGHVLTRLWGAFGAPQFPHTPTHTPTPGGPLAPGGTLLAKGPLGPSLGLPVD